MKKFKVFAKETVEYVKNVYAEDKDGVRELFEEEVEEFTQEDIDRTGDFEITEIEEIEL